MADHNSGPVPHIIHGTNQTHRTTALLLFIIQFNDYKEHEKICVTHWRKEWCDENEKDIIQNQEA